ncbi:PQQ-binding-like beta-propeller repeat protein [Nannocystis pusilla]|uniref:outer membrane protein assembly factor BamB family protein n=1 Tax=Nannocystis pusilla TaxID=889268 RepID=UPI003DA21330
MPKHSSSPHTVAKLTAALHTPRLVDAGAVYWSSDDFRFAAASLAGEPLWDVEVEDGSRLVGLFDGHPVVLTRGFEPPFACALVFLDPASGREVRRVAAPEHTTEAAYHDGVFAFLTAAERFEAANRLVLADAATGKSKKVVEGGHATGLTAFVGGFLCTLDFVVRAYDLKGRSLWTTDNVVSVFGETVLATNVGGKLARLRPTDGTPLWSFTFKGAEARSLVQVHAGADAVAVLEPRLGELALLDLATGKLRWRTKRVAATTFAPPLVTPDAVVTLSAKLAGGGWPALAVFSLADGSLRAELANRHGFNMMDGLVAGEVCVLGQEDGQALHLVRVPASDATNATRTGANGKASAGKSGAKKSASAASAKKSAANKSPVSASSVKKTRATTASAKKTRATTASAKKTAAKKPPAAAAATKKTAAKKTAAKTTATKKTAAKTTAATKTAATKTAAKKRAAK